MSSANALAYFDKEAETVIITDASPVGLCAVLLQEQQGVLKAVSYASRCLTDVERRYSQTEKEALSIVWACERFHVYLYGIKFNVLSDHKPLEVIYSKAHKSSERIEGWVLRLQPYDFTVEYLPGPKSVLSKDIINCLDRIFATHGIPQSMKTGNGPQFISSEFEDYLKSNDIRHLTSTQLWPRANGEVERENRSLLKAMRIGQATGKDWRKELNKFLLAYRSTPHTVTGVSPAKLLFGRGVLTKIRCLEHRHNLMERLIEGIHPM